MTVRLLSARRSAASTVNKAAASSGAPKLGLVNSPAYSGARPYVDVLQAVSSVIDENLWLGLKVLTS